MNCYDFLAIDQQQPYGVDVDVSDDEMFRTKKADDEGEARGKKKKRRTNSICKKRMSLIKASSMSQSIKSRVFIGQQVGWRSTRERTFAGEMKEKLRRLEKSFFAFREECQTKAERKMFFV